jgi:lipoprotein-releasing system permease protein
MSLTFNIARRYLFGKKSINAINIITGISVFGITIGSAALILILSVFNGFESLISGYFNAFNPEIKMLPVKGKTFVYTKEMQAKLDAVDGLFAYSKVLEEVVMFRYDDLQDFGVIKGVDGQFNVVNQIDSTLRRGAFKLTDGSLKYGIVGSGLAGKLNINTDNSFTPIQVYVPKRTSSGPLNNYFIQTNVYPSGIFAVQNETDFKYVVTDLEVVQYLLQQKNTFSAIEIKSSGNVSQLKKDLQALFGNEFVFKDRFEQDEVFMKIMNMEKWISYLIVSLTLFLVAFNMIGTLWMIVLDKKKDVSTLKAMGATRYMIRKIFLLEGIFIAVLGLIFGILIALIFYFLQKQYGLIGIPDGFVINAYPIKIELLDFIVVSLTVLLIGFIISLPPAWKAGEIRAYIKEE